MKIYNKIVIEWNEETQHYDKVVYEDSFEYEGEMALCSCSTDFDCQCGQNGTPDCGLAWCNVVVCEYSGCYWCGTGSGDGSGQGNEDSSEPDINCCCQPTSWCCRFDDGNDYCVDDWCGIYGAQVRSEEDCLNGNHCSGSGACEDEYGITEYIGCMDDAALNYCGVCVYEPADICVYDDGTLSPPPEPTDFASTSPGENWPNSNAYWEAHAGICSVDNLNCSYVPGHPENPLKYPANDGYESVIIGSNHAYYDTINDHPDTNCSLFGSNQSFFVEHILEYDIDGNARTLCHCTCLAEPCDFYSHPETGCDNAPGNISLRKYCHRSGYCHQYYWDACRLSPFPWGHQSCLPGDGACNYNYQCNSLVERPDTYCLPANGLRSPWPWAQSQMTEVWEGVTYLGEAFNDSEIAACVIQDSCEGLCPRSPGQLDQTALEWSTIYKDADNFNLNKGAGMSFTGNLSGGGNEYCGCDNLCMDRDDCCSDYVQQCLKNINFSAEFYTINLQENSTENNDKLITIENPGSPLTAGAQCFEQSFTWNILSPEGGGTSGDMVGGQTICWESAIRHAEYIEGGGGVECCIEGIQSNPTGEFICTGSEQVLLTYKQPNNSNWVGDDQCRIRATDNLGRTKTSSVRINIQNTPYSPELTFFTCPNCTYPAYDSDDPWENFDGVDNFTEITITEDTYTELEIIATDQDDDDLRFEVQNVNPEGMLDAYINETESTPSGESATLVLSPVENAYTDHNNDSCIEYVYATIMVCDAEIVDGWCQNRSSYSTLEISISQVWDEIDTVSGDNNPTVWEDSTDTTFSWIVSASGDVGTCNPGSYSFDVPHESFKLPNGGSCTPGLDPEGGGGCYIKFASVVEQDTAAGTADVRIVPYENYYGDAGSFVLVVTHGNQIKEITLPVTVRGIIDRPVFFANFPTFCSCLPGECIGDYTGDGSEGQQNPIYTCTVAEFADWEHEIKTISPDTPTDLVPVSGWDPTWMTLGATVQDEDGITSTTLFTVSPGENESIESGDSHTVAFQATSYGAGGMMTQITYPAAPGGGSAPSNWHLVGLPYIVPWACSVTGVDYGYDGYDTCVDDCDGPCGGLYTTIFPESIPGTLYEFDGTYVNSSVLEPGKGYWLNFPVEGSTVTFEGEFIETLTITLMAGWNLVSGPSEVVFLSNVEDPGNIVVPGSLYGFSGTYSDAGFLAPGHAYWLRAFGDGDITWSGMTGDSGIAGDIPLYDVLTLHLDITEENNPPMSFEYWVDLLIYYGEATSSTTITFHNEASDWDAIDDECGGYHIPILNSDTMNFGENEQQCAYDIDFGDDPDITPATYLAVEILSWPHYGKLTDGAGGDYTDELGIVDSIVYPSDNLLSVVYELYSDIPTTIDTTDDFLYRVIECDSSDCANMVYQAAGNDVLKASAFNRVHIGISTPNLPPAMILNPDMGMTAESATNFNSIPIVDDIHTGGNPATMTLRATDYDLREYAEGSAWNQLDGHVEFKILELTDFDDGMTGLNSSSGVAFLSDNPEFSANFKTAAGKGDHSNGLFTHPLDIWISGSPGSTDFQFSFDVAVYDIDDGMRRKCTPRILFDGPGELHTNPDCWDQTTPQACDDLNDLGSADGTDCNWFAQRARLRFHYIPDPEDISTVDITDESVSASASDLHTGGITENITLVPYNGDVAIVDSTIDWGVSSVTFDRQLDSTACNILPLARNDLWSYRIKFKGDGPWVDVEDLLQPSTGLITGTDITIDISKNNSAPDLEPRDQYWPGTSETGTITIGLYATYVGSYDGSPLSLFTEGNMVITVGQMSGNIPPIAPAPPYKTCHAGSSYNYGFDYTDAGTLYSELDSDVTLAYDDDTIIAIRNPGASGNYDVPITVYDPDNSSANTGWSITGDFAGQTVYPMPAHDILYAVKTFSSSPPSYDLTSTWANPDGGSAIVHSDISIGSTSRVYFHPDTKYMLTQGEFSPGQEVFDTEGGINVGPDGWCVDTTGLYEGDSVGSCWNRWAYGKIGGCKYLDVELYTPEDCPEYPSNFTSLSMYPSYDGTNANVEIVGEMRYFGSFSPDSCVEFHDDPFFQVDDLTNPSRANYIVVGGTDYDPGACAEISQYDEGNGFKNFAIMAIDPTTKNNSFQYDGDTYNDNEFECTHPDNDNVYMGIDACTSGCTGMWCDGTNVDPNDVPWTNQSCCENSGWEWWVNASFCPTGCCVISWIVPDMIPDETAELADYGGGYGICTLTDNLVTVVAEACRSEYGEWNFGSNITLDINGVYRECIFCPDDPGCYRAEKVAFTHTTAAT